jgi:hypothetical protein
LAYSTLIHFVPLLNFDQSIIASIELNPSSNTYFLFRDGPTDPGSIDQYTGFYGTIDTITVNVPELPTWAMMLLGFAGLGFAFPQSRRKVS